MPTVVESYSTVSSLPRSMPSRFLSKPSGGAGNFSVGSSFWAGAGRAVPASKGPGEQGHDASAHDSSFREGEEVGPVIGRHPASSASAIRAKSRTSVSASPGRRASSICARIDSPAVQSRRNARMPSAVRATVRARASVGCVSRSTSPRPLQQDEHGPHGAGVGRHAAGEFPLGEGMPTPGEGGEEDELVGGDAVRRERRVRPAVEGQVRGAEGDREVVSGGHRRVVHGRGRIRASTHDRSCEHGKAAVVNVLVRK